MKTSVNIFNELNDSFNEEFKKLQDLKESEKAELSKKIAEKKKKAKKLDKEIKDTKIEDLDGDKAKELEKTEKEVETLEDKVKNKTLTENYTKEDIDRIKAEPRSEKYETGLKLRDEIVEAWKNKDLKTAYAKWEELFDMFSTPVDEEGNEIEGYSEENSLRDIIERTMITDTIESQCVYDVTDYGKEKAYREMGYYESEEPVKECDKVEEGTTVQLPLNNDEDDLDYIINDVTILEPTADGDVQAPDIDALLTLVDESLKAEYGDKWGHIKVLSSRIDENSSFALVDIATPEIMKEFEEKGITDVAIGKNLILENANKLVEFKVNSLNGTTKYSKKSNNPQQAIKEWLETEFLAEAKKQKVEMEELEKAKNEKETVENYIACKPELRMEIENIKMFVEMSKQIKDEGFTEMVQNRMYGFAAEFPANIEVTNKDDKYELKFANRDEIVEYIFGKEWAKDPADEIPGNEVVGVVKESVAEVEFSEGQTLVLDKVGNGIVIFHYETEEGRDGPFESDIIKGHYFKDEEGHTWDLRSDFGINGGLNESYTQFNIGEIEVVFNPDTYECLYSIPSAEVEDKKINLTEIPTVETPYDTNTIIKSYVETKFGRIPSKEEKELQDKGEVSKPEPEEKIDVNVEEPAGDTEVKTDVDVDVPVEDDKVNTVTTSEEEPTEEVQEDELPEEPDKAELQGEPAPQEQEEAQAETGNATFIKIRPKQNIGLEEIREKLVSEDTPTSNYIVVDEKVLSPEEFDDFVNQLNNEQPFLQDIKSIDRKNYSFNVVKISSPNSQYSLLVDPLGYSYPRYVAIDEGGLN